MEKLEKKLLELNEITIDLLNEIAKIRRPQFTKREREHLIEDLVHYRIASGHKYTHVEYSVSIFGNTWERIYLYYTSERTGEERFDMLSGNPCYTRKMEPNKKYTLKELGIYTQQVEK